MTHRYTQRVTLVGVAGATTNQTFSCNGLYDPDTTGTGKQPYYFDQLTNIYRHYTVLASKLTVRVCGRAANSVPSLFTIYINDDATVLHTNADNAAENPTAVFKMIGPGSNDEVVLRKAWKASENFGPGVISDPNLQGTDTANPAEQQHFSMVYNALDGSSSVTVDMICTIEYQTIWQELREVQTS